MREGAAMHGPRDGEAMAGASSIVPAPSRDHPAHRLQALDAIRGIAAFVVVLGHSIEQAIRFMPPTGALRPVLEAVFIEYLNLGRIGVVAFFLLSGYVIPFSFSHDRPVRSFLIARFFRLYPAYWVSGAGAIMLALVLTGALPPARQILANITMVQAVLGQKDLIGVYWTLFYELLFYALCLGAFLAGRMESPGYLLVAVAGLSAAGVGAAILRRMGGPGVPIGIPMFLAIMHLGTMARLADRGDKPGAGRLFRTGLAIVLVTAGPISAIGFIQHAGNQRLIADVTSLYVGLALFLGLRRNPGICVAPLLFLGLISYALYLVHPLALDLIVSLAARVAPGVAPVMVVALVPTLAILIATAVQRGVERPMGDLSRSVRRRAAAA
jgi:peptidoglycan/LPS O-acetylase OafA/YrhL